MTNVGTMETSEAQALAKSLFAWTKDARWRVKEVRGEAEAAARGAARARGGDEFRGMFLNACARAVGRGGMGEHECYALSRLVCAVASEEGDEGATAKALETLARLRARGARAFSSKAFRRYASARGGGEVIDAYVKLVKATGGSNPVVCALVNDAFVERRASARDVDETRKEFLEVFCSVVLGGDAKVAKAGVTSAMFASVLEDVTSEELRDVLIPKVIRQLRRSPEAALPAVVGCFKTLRGDLSRRAVRWDP